MPKKKKKFAISPKALILVAAGLLLLATPYLVAHEGYSGTILIARLRTNPPLDKALILVGRHNIDGAMGFIINRPLTEEQRAHLSPFIRNAGIPVGYGGPLDTTDQIFVLEEKKPAKPGEEPDIDISSWDDAVKATPDLLDRIRQSIKNGEQRYRVLTGYVGWGPFQLEAEILLRNIWKSIPSTHDIVFQNGDATHWDALERKAKSAGEKPLNRT